MKYVVDINGRIVRNRHHQYHRYMHYFIDDEKYSKSIEETPWLSEEGPHVSAGHVGPGESRAGTSTKNIHAYLPAPPPSRVSSRLSTSAAFE